MTPPPDGSTPSPRNCLAQANCDHQKELVADDEDEDRAGAIDPPDQNQEPAVDQQQEEQPAGSEPDPPADSAAGDQQSLSQNDAMPDNVACDPHNAARAALLAMDQTDAVALWHAARVYSDLVDDLEGLNNYAPQVMRLSNMCQNIRSARSSFDRPFDRVLQELDDVRDQIPECIPLPLMLPVPGHLRRKKIAPQPQCKQSLIESLTDPDIEEIAFIANKKADGDVRDYFAGNREPKSFPLTSHLQDLENSRPSKSSSTSSKTYHNAGQDNWRTDWKPRSRKSGVVMNNYQNKKRRVNHSEEDDIVDVESVDEPKLFAGAGMCGFKPPFKSAREELEERVRNGHNKTAVSGPATSAAAKGFKSPFTASKPEPTNAFKNIDDDLIDKVMNEIIVPVQDVSWDDIAGLQHAKERIKELVVLPLLRPDLFQGIRAPGKGLLLFGPPGTGKSMIGKCIASRSNATFFSMSASSLTSKWIGEGEKMVRAMFAVARKQQPSVIFIDEIDSLLCQRTGQEHEASTRLKTEFLMQFEGVGDTELDKLLVVGATNRPEALDEAARRRFTKRLFIGLPDEEARGAMVRKLMLGTVCSLSDEEFASIAKLTDGYSGSDMKSLCKEAAMGPIRCALATGSIENISGESLRSVGFSDFQTALQEVKPSVSPSEVTRHEDFNRQFGALHM